MIFGPLLRLLHCFLVFLHKARVKPIAKMEDFNSASGCETMLARFAGDVKSKRAGRVPQLVAAPSRASRGFSRDVGCSDAKEVGMENPAERNDRVSNGRKNDKGMGASIQARKEAGGWRHSAFTFQQHRPLSLA